MFENPPFEIPPHESENKRNQFENAFTSAVVRALLDSLEDAMYECDYSDEDIESYKSALNNLSDEEKKAVLAVPDTLREHVFHKYKKKLDAGEITPQGIVTSQLEQARKHGFTIGYHVSNQEIPRTTTKDGEEEWIVKGTELDDRDDMKMAYYSLDHRNLFRKRRGDYIYLVRASTAGKYSDKQDQNNNWGRAPSLSIIESVPKREIETLAEEIEQSTQSEKDKAGTSQEEAPA